MKKTKLTFTIISFSILMLNSCAQFLNNKMGYTVPEASEQTVASEVEFNDSHFDDKLNSHVITEDWENANWNTHVIEVRIQGTPTDDIGFLEISSWVDSEEEHYTQIFSGLVASELKKGEPFDITKKFPLFKQISSTKSYSYNLAIYDLEKKEPDKNIKNIENCKISFNIIESEFLFSSPNQYDTCQHHIQCNEITKQDSLNFIDGKYINLHLSFDTPEPIYWYEFRIVRNIDNWQDSDSYLIKYVQKGQNDINVSFKLNFPNKDKIPAEGFNIDECRLETWYWSELDWCQRQNPKEGIVLSNFNVELTVTDEPLNKSWKFDGKKLTILTNNALDTIPVEKTFFETEGIDVSKVESIIIEEGVTYIPYKAFKDCTALKTLTLPSTLEIIESDAFMGNQIDKVTIPSSVTYIDWNILNGAKTIILDWNSADTTERFIRDGAFNGSTVKYKDGIVYSGDSYSYQISDDGKTFTVTGTGEIEGYKYNGFSFTNNTEQHENFSSVTSIVIPEGITKLGESAFNECFNVTSISLPSTLETIDNWAFCHNNCTEITIPSSVKTIGKYAFEQNDNTKKLVITLDWASTDSTARDISEDAFGSVYYVKYNDNKPYENQNTMFTDYWELENGKLTIKNQNAFNGIDSDHYFFEVNSINKDKAHTLIFNENIKTIPRNAFFDCPNIDSIRFNFDLEKIESYAFYNTGCSTIFIPPSVTTIEAFAFTSTQNPDLYIYLDWESTDTTTRNLDTMAFYGVAHVYYSDGVAY